MSGETISNALKIKRRTYFRKYQQALNSFSSCLIKCGFDCKKIYNLVKDETWILDVFKTYLEKENLNSKEPEISNYSIYSLALRNLKTEKRVVREVYSNVFA